MHVRSLSELRRELPSKLPRVVRTLGPLALALLACSKSEGVTSGSPAAPPASASAAPAAAFPVVPAGVSPSASYLLSLDTRGCAVELRINDVPLLSVEADRPRALGEVIDPWLKVGVNGVSLAARTNVSKGCASLSVLAIPEGGDQRTAPRVLEAVWPPADLARGEQAFEFFGPTTERCRLWQDAAPLELDAAGKSELLGEVRALHRLFVKRDVTAFARRADYRARDIARCLRKAPESGVEDQKKFLELVTSATPFSPTPLDESALTLELVGGRKLVWAHRKDARLLFENGLGQGMDLYFAKVDGRWAVVR
jgi:hypothetical protein